MKKIILPKTIIWTLLSGLGFLLLMSFIRIVFVYKFPAPTSTDHHLQSAYILGFRYDLENRLQDLLQNHIGKFDHLPMKKY